MWVKFKQNYAGVYGQFFKDEKRDVPEDILQKLPKGLYAPCVPPSEEYADKAGMEKAELKARANDAAQWAGVCRDKAVEAAAITDKLTPLVEEKQKQMDMADEAAKDAVEAAGKSGTEKAKKHAAGLARNAEIKELEHQKAIGEWSAAEADANLKRIAAEDAESKAKQLACELEEQYPRPKPKTEAKKSEKSDEKA